MVVSESGKVTDSISEAWVQYWKVLFPRTVTFLPSIVSGTTIFVSVPSY